MKNTTNSIFNLYLNNKIVKQSINELYDKLDRGLIWGNSYIFDEESSCWLIINNHPIFKKFNVTFEINQSIPVKPKRIPSSDNLHHNKNSEDSHLLEYIENYKCKFDQVMEENLSLINENINLKMEMRLIRGDAQVTKTEYNLNIKSLNKELTFYTKYQNDQDAYCKKLEKEVDSLRKQSSDKSISNIEKISKLSKENTELHKMLEKKEEYLSNKNLEIRRLVKDIQKLESENESLVSYDKDRSDDIIQLLNGEIKALKVEISSYKELENKNKLLEKDKQTALYENRKLRDIITQLNQKLDKTIDEKINVENNHLLFQKKYKKDISSVKNSFLNYEQKIKVEKSKNLDLNNSLIKEQSRNQKLSELLNQKKQVNNLVGKRTKKNQDSSVGKVFEIDNSPHWEVKGSLDKYRFSEIKNMFEKKKILPKTFIRKEGAWWRKVSDVTELQNPLLIQNIDGEEKCYIERSSFRVPLSFGKAEVTIGTGAILNGRCVNVSVDGCFIEMKKLKDLSLSNEDLLGIKIKLDESNEIKFEGSLKQFSNDNSGFGVEITDIDSETKIILANFVNSFLTSLDEVA